MAKFLAIDDNPDNLISLKALISEAFPDAKLLQATSGPIGLELAKHEDPDVVLLDVIMPGMDGFEVCRRLKSDILLREIPVVFLTALKGDKESRIRALECGGEAFLAKPIDETELKAQLLAMIKIKRANMEKRDEAVRLAELVQERTMQLQQELDERKKAEAALLKNEEQLRGIFDNLQDAYFQADATGKFTMVSPSALKMYGFESVNEIIGQPAEMLYANSNVRSVMLTRLREAQRIDDFVCQARRKDGSTFWASMNVKLLFNSDGSIKGTEGLVRDINERIKTENALNESEAKYRLLAEHMTDTVWLMDLNLQTTYISPSLEKLRGYSLEELRQLPIEKQLTPESFKRAIQAYSEEIDKINADRSYFVTLSLELETYRKDGSTFWSDNTFTLIRDEDGNPVSILAEGRDITERKLAEDQLKEMNDLLSKFISNSPIFTYIKEVTPTESRVLKASENFVDMVGIPGSQMDGKTMEELFPPDFAAKITADDWHVASQGQLIVIDEELNGRFYTTIKFPINEGEKVLLAGYTIDITQQKQTENELRKLSRALEQSPDSILITNTKGEIEFVNPSLVKLSGFSAEELMGKNPRIFKSGETSKEEYKQLWDTIASGKVWEGELHNRKKNGELFWESATISPVFDANGKITHYLAIRKDISEQKRMTNELIQAKNHAEESDRLKSAFLANMSHEIRTPMNSIMGFASLLPEEESRELMIQYANIIVQNSEQLVSLIDSIVIYSKLQSGMFVYHPTHFKVDKLLADVQQSFNLPIFQKGVNLSCQCNLCGNTQLFSDYDKLRQILNNLITNAFKYTPQGEITLGCDRQSESYVFWIKDTGIGIPEKDIDHVFERFYRGSNINEARTRGTGLGLSIVKELVEMLGGNIWVESEEGKGSCFYISIPF